MNPTWGFGVDLGYHSNTANSDAKLAGLDQVNIFNYGAHALYMVPMQGQFHPYLQAGLEGVEHDLDPGEPLAQNMYLLDDQELHKLGVSTLPRTLLEAVEALDADPFMEQVLGRELQKAFVELKTQEWWDYHNTVTPWEIERYLTFF